MAKEGKNNKKGFGEILEDSPKSELEVVMLNKCERLFNDGKFDDTIQCCIDLENKKPDISITHYYRGMSIYNKGNLDEALAELEKGINKDPTFWLLHSAKGLILYRKGKYNDALKSLNESLKYAADLSTLVLASVCAIMTGNNVLAGGYIKKAAGIDVKTTSEILDSFISALLNSGMLSTDMQKKMEDSRKKMNDEISKLKEIEKEIKNKKKK